MDVEAPRGLLRFFDDLEDPRMERTRLHYRTGFLPTTPSGVFSAFWIRGNWNSVFSVGWRRWRNAPAGS